MNLTQGKSIPYFHGMLQVSWPTSFSVILMFVPSISPQEYWDFACMSLNLDFFFIWAPGI